MYSRAPNNQSIRHGVHTLDYTQNRFTNTSKKMLDIQQELYAIDDNMMEPEYTCSRDCCVKRTEALELPTSSAESFPLLTQYPQP